MRRTAYCLLLLLPLLSACSKTDDRLKALEERLAKAEQSAAEHRAITLKPGDKGYGLVETDVGRIAVAIAAIEPTPTGSRVILDFGNPTAARLTGMKAKVEWGSTDAKGLPMAPSSQSFGFTAPEPLPAGSWHQYPMDLTGVQPTQLGWIKISEVGAGTVDLLNQ